MTLRRCSRHWRPAGGGLDGVSLLWGAECLSHLGPFLLPAILQCKIRPCPVYQLQRQQQQQQQEEQQQQQQQQQHQGRVLLLHEEQTEAIAGITAAAAAAAAAGKEAGSAFPQPQQQRQQQLDDDGKQQQQQQQQQQQHNEGQQQQQHEGCRYSAAQWNGLLRLVFRILDIVPPESRANCRAIISNELAACREQQEQEQEQQQQPAEEKKTAPVLEYLRDPTAIYTNNGFLSKLGAGLAVLKGLRGLCILEMVYCGEETLINTSQYFDNKTFRSVGSVAMLLLNSCTLAFIMKTHKYG
ncbi:hypothetical protein, conserved [Eimeria maxima]|uniref:Uncharacterized protein n=1 Tax=Eimeria maxima TaxID=5804 RepID=U6M556_EIMMA|nr:hypothetical protein, conserved [Eimeria maxima]CDJ57554.1 hypothetical protein, conserved [Eimeria maxima]